MPKLSRRKRVIAWTAVGLVMLPFAILLIAYLESSLGTSYVEDFFRWLAWHEPIRLFLRDLLL